MERMGWRCATISAAILLLTAPVWSASFDENKVAEFYRGKQIRIVIGSGPGAPTTFTRACCQNTWAVLFLAIRL